MPVQAMGILEHFLNKGSVTLGMTVEKSSELTSLRQ
jgi:hypothetical protein